jgi:tetratricopeptide (TPR) repeat protein
MTYRPGNRNLRSIAETLGVANVVEGTVRRDGNRVRITIRLVDARRDKTLWSEVYDRSLTDIFAIQSEIAQKVASKLSAQLSPQEKKQIEERPTRNLEAYALYLRGKELVQNIDVLTIERAAAPLHEAVGLLEQALNLDPKFTLAYCVATWAHNILYLWFDPTPERRALADTVVNYALCLQPHLPEVRLAYAHYLYVIFRDYEQARVQLAVALAGLPNSAEASLLAASIDRRQGNFEKAIQEFNKASELDPRNTNSIAALSRTLFFTRHYRAANQAFQRLIEFFPDQPILKLENAFDIMAGTGDETKARSALAALPKSMIDDTSVLSYRLELALIDRDWLQAKELINKMQKRKDEAAFSYVQGLAPIGCHSILLARLQGERFSATSSFEETRERLSQKVQRLTGNATVLSQLAVVDALLDKKEAAISEGKAAVEMVPIFKDAVDGTALLANLAVVYAWTGELDLALATLDPLTKMPSHIAYGDLKLRFWWIPLREDPRFDKFLAQLAPNESLQKAPSGASHVRTHKPSVSSGPKKISVSRLPVTGSDLFGRKEDIAFLDRAWANKDVNIVTIVAWAGVGKSTLVNHWLRRIAIDHYRSAELIFGWSFYRQGTSGDTSSADEFLDTALSWFGDPDPRLGTAWEKGERLAKLVAHSRTLLILDGLEPLQNPPGPQEGRLREPSLEALLRELAAFNKGLCVITTRMTIADIADHEQSSALRRDLEQISKEAGAKLLRALGVKGDEAELRRASEEFRGHCLALTLLGSYLTDAFNGDIRFRHDVSDRLAHDVRQGVHAQKVMESYQKWFGEGPELAVLRTLGLFDRPAEEKAITALLESPKIPGLTESLTDLSQIERRTIIARLRRARLLAAEDPNNPWQLDAHPLVREYFGEQLRIQRASAWRESNRRLYDYYRALAPELPQTFTEMEPLFLAVICGCNAGLYREALCEVYIPRIQRGNSSFAVNVLGARGILLTVLSQFFENGRWESPIVKGTREHSLNEEDQLFILLQAGQHLTATRGFSAPEARICYERAEPLCQSLRRPLLLYVALMGQWNYSFVTDKLTATMQIAERVYSLALEEKDSALIIGANFILAMTHYYMGHFDIAAQYTEDGLRIWRLGLAKSPVEEVDVPAVSCFCFKAILDWHAAEIASCWLTIAEAISLAKKLNDTHGLAKALHYEAVLGVLECDPAKVEGSTSDLMELSTRQHFAHWLAVGNMLRGWARSACGDTAQGILWIEDGIGQYRASGSIIGLSFWLALKAEALHLANRTSEALDAIREAEALIKKSEQHNMDAELHRLRGVFLTAVGTDEAEIEDSFCEAIRIAKDQKSISLAKRAEATYAEYRRQKASASGRRGFRLSL